MANTVTLSKQQYQKLLNRVNALEQTVQSLVENLKDKLDIEPPYGSDAWWKWSVKKGEEDIKKGRSTTIKNKKELDAFFEHL